MERRLVAVLAADVVGYSRLMGADEAGTLNALKAHRVELIDPKAAQYNGRTIKLMGDGALMEFPSVVEAVTFAVEIQIAMHERNRGVPEDRRITYRIPYGGSPGRARLQPPIANKRLLRPNSPPSPFWHSRTSPATPAKATCQMPSPKILRPSFPGFPNSS